MPQYRVYCFLGLSRYYWSHGYWSMWSWAATPLTLTEAEEIATRENGTVESILEETCKV